MQETCESLKPIETGFISVVEPTLPGHVNNLATFSASVSRFPTLAQILIYQNGLFVPFMDMGRGAKVFLLVWRMLFVTAYWLVTLSTAGIAVAGARIWGVVSTVVAVVTSIIGVVLQLRKH